jgi:two-component system OmpR family sensor kinase/two-component system sensor histidine kinase BaeS
MNRLWVQLTLAFTAAVVIGIGAAAFMANFAIDREFRDFLARSEAAIEDSGLADQLVAYYEQNQGWADIDSALAVSGRSGALPPGSPRGGNHFRLPLLLADADGRIVYDNRGQRRGSPLTAAERDSAIALESQGTVVGYVTIEIGPVDQLLPGERAFVDRVRQNLVIAALIAGSVGIGLGLALSRNIARPLNRLATAARAIAAKDLSQRVEPMGAAEVMEVGHAFNEMAASLEKAEDLRRNLVADVAHELRTPLSVLQGNLTALLDGVYPLEPSEIARLADEARLLSRLVDDLRELAQAEAGQLALELRATDLAAVVQTTVEVFGPVAGDKQVALIHDAPASLPPVRVDAGRVAQVLRNLLSNALRHTSPGGTIRVAAAVVPGGVEVSVSDTGEGIAPADLPHVFERFWRGDKSRVRETGGSGLGLAIARRLIELQRGQIGVESQPGRGSRFWFRFPVY